MVDESVNDWWRALPCGFFSFSDSGELGTVNPTLLNYLDYRADELAGKKVEDILTLPTRIFYQTHFFPLLKMHGQASEIYLTLRSSRDAGVPVLVNAVRREQDGVIVNGCACMPLERREQYEQEILKAKHQAEAALQNDAALTETRDELETQYRLLDKRASRLAQKNQELMQLSELIAHDFQEPLRKIILFADLLATRNASTLTPESLDYTEKIIAHGQAMRQLIHSVQKYVGLDIQEPKFQLCGLSTLAYRAKTQLDAKYGDRAFRLVLKQKLPAVVCASDQVELMFYHLFENAIKFAHPGQEALIEVEAEEIRHNTYQAIQEKYRYVDFVKITVRDSGRGFENRESDYIFGLLKKLEPDTPGHGIGLAICKKIVENHYGSISARSEPGRGAAFTVLLPQSQVV